ncbi:MAG: gamma-glutamyl-gamma-aminobutyrate hydrolase family protein [Pseudonocardia sp.]|nr:gamma-glutamyl-gamma-aminobutyrate hydrolase family protein [Pseudonocardia sp.]
MTGPVVGITGYGELARYWLFEHEAVLIPRSYTDVVAAAGGVPVVLPPTALSAALVDRVDALILAGGPDVAPARYGAAPAPNTDPPRDERDEAELAVLRRALDRDVPVLAVCRGHQLLNVALGGTLHQHVPDLVGHVRHSPEPAVYGEIDVRTERDTLVRSLVGEDTRVRCHHHQAVDRLGEGLRVAARAEDDVVEAVELAGRRFVVGVQWHPEQDATDLRLVAGLLQAATDAGAAA